MKRKKIDLNKYERVSEADDWHLCIIPADVQTTDGKVLPQPKLFFQSLDVPEEVVDVDNATWFPGVRISKQGSQADYNKRVDWWFDNLGDDMKEDFNKTFGSIFDVSSVAQQAKMWLKTCPKRKRKVLLNRFLYGWMNTEANKSINRNRWYKSE